jgi:hypothetical protein
MVRERGDIHPQTSSQGLLSGVFSFVSREIECFVTSATGGEVSYFIMFYIIIFGFTGV